LEGVWAGGGDRTSSLRFRSDDPKSLIRQGGGYWLYLPTDAGVRFLTWYDYEVRFGAVGRLADRCIFRPWMGWATAWSFDRLRLWMEEEQAPEASLVFALIHAVARHWSDGSDMARRWLHAAISVLAQNPVS
jgi:hypothetical protein